MSTREMIDKINEEVEQKPKLTPNPVTECVFCFDSNCRTAWANSERITNEIVKQYFVNKGITACNHIPGSYSSSKFVDFITESFLRGKCGAIMEPYRILEIFTDYEKLDSLLDYYKESHKKNLEEWVNGSVERTSVTSRTRERLEELAKSYLDCDGKTDDWKYIDEIDHGTWNLMKYVIEIWHLDGQCQYCKDIVRSVGKEWISNLDPKKIEGIHMIPNDEET